MKNWNNATQEEKLAAIRARLVDVYGEARAGRIIELATTTHKGRLDSVAYSRFVDAAAFVASERLP